mmetsp:Transcript_408/g.1067  ORF Transcript_408/g.1067 Transcript_408/m.1067 type:complete len:232 (+) Transcript_408:539-1234(+)
MDMTYGVTATEAAKGSTPSTEPRANSQAAVPPMLRPVTYTRSGSTPSWMTFSMANRRVALTERMSQWCFLDLAWGMMTTISSGQRGSQKVLSASPMRPPSSWHAPAPCKKRSAGRFSSAPSGFGGQTIKKSIASGSNGGFLLSSRSPCRRIGGIGSRPCTTSSFPPESICSCCALMRLVLCSCVPGSRSSTSPWCRPPGTLRPSGSSEAGCRKRSGSRRCRSSQGQSSSSA